MIVGVVSAVLASLSRKMASMESSLVKRNRN